MEAAGLMERLFAFQMINKRARLVYIADNFCGSYWYWLTLMRAQSRSALTCSWLLVRLRQVETLGSLNS